MTTATPQFKITYSTLGADMGEFHKAFDEALEQARKQMGSADHPLRIAGHEVSPKDVPYLEHRSPIDNETLVGSFPVASAEHVDEAVKAARKAQKAWAAKPWAERCAILRKAAARIRDQKYLLSAVMSIEVGKSRMEAMGEVEESADLIDYYCQQMEDAAGFTRPLGKIQPNEKTQDVLRPYGVFACIAPFNFPLALSAGMSSAAIVAGNAVVYKPAQDAPLSGELLYEAYKKAGLPPGVFQCLFGDGRTTGSAMWKHPGVDGIVFTGSKDVGMRMHHEFSSNFVKPVLMELGGKNPAVVTASADLDKAAEGVMRSAFGLQGQKCSACSRVYVDQKVEKAFTEKLIEKTKAIKIGDPTQKDVFFGPVITKKAVETYEQAVALAKKDGEILIGGERLKKGALAKGNYVAPTVARLPLGHELFRRELFVPFLAITAYATFNQALEECNKADYGLTAGIFTEDKKEIARFFDEVEAGVCYANRRSGATTGAWPGVQSFTGWKGSGGSGKGGCGPYYVAQFMREQSRTVME